MATPYFQFRHDQVPSTQDIARDAVDSHPVLVIAASQSSGRGRTGSGWLNADRALAVSYAFPHRQPDDRPFSLMAGVVALEVVGEREGLGLKWPNDILAEGDKVGGILVERSGDVTVVGMGLNLFWPDPPSGMAGLAVVDPGESMHIELGALWGAGMNRLIDAEGWPADVYRESCLTLGQDVVWEPDGAGKAVDIDDDGALIVDRGGVRERVVSGEIRHMRV